MSAADYNRKLYLHQPVVFDIMLSFVLTIYFFLSSQDISSCYGLLGVYYITDKLFQIVKKPKIQHHIQYVQNHQSNSYTKKYVKSIYIVNLLFIGVNRTREEFKLTLFIPAFIILSTSSSDIRPTLCACLLLL